jgi:hypothetical protein
MDQIGIDLGKKRSDVCVMSAVTTVSERFKCDTTRATLTERFARRPTAQIAIEACRSSGWVHELLTGLCHTVVVVDTSRVRQIGVGHGRRKTDRRDAEALARSWVRPGAGPGDGRPCPNPVHSAATVAPVSVASVAGCPSGHGWTSATDAGRLHGVRAAVPAGRPASDVGADNVVSAERALVCGFLVARHFQETAHTRRSPSFVSDASLRRRLFQGRHNPMMPADTVGPCRSLDYPNDPEAYSAETGQPTDR